MRVQPRKLSFNNSAGSAQYNLKGNILGRSGVGSQRPLVLSAGGGARGGAWGGSTRSRKSMPPSWASSHTSVARSGARRGGWWSWRGGARRGGWCCWGAVSGGKDMSIMWGSSVGGCWGEGSPPKSMSSEERGSGGVEWDLWEKEGRTLAEAGCQGAKS